MRAKPLGLMLGIPKTWNLKGAVHLLLQVLGLTKEYVLKQLEKRVKSELGEEAVARLQQLGGPLLTLLHAGPAALWKQISDNTEDLLQAAFDSVKGKLLAMLGVGVAKFLAKLAIPGGAIVQVLESTYDVYQTVVARAKEILKVGLTLFNAAQSLEQGNTRLAAKSIEGVLAQLLPVALDFLARTFKLDKLPVLVRAALKALRAPVDKGLNWVVDKIIAAATIAWKAIKAGGTAVAAAGRDAVGAVKGWLGLRQPFTNPEGEQHTLFLEQGADGPRLMVASTPQALERYLIAARATATPRVLNLINNAEAARQQLATYTVGVDGPAVAQNVKSLLTRISRLLALIGGHTLRTLPLPLTPGFVAIPGAAKKASVLHVSSQTAYVGGNISSLKPHGWELLQDAGLTDKTQWVKMHMISDKTGGPALEENLLPAPRYTNSVPVLDFENQVKDLMTTPKPVSQESPDLHKKPTVLWVIAQATGFHPAGVTPITARLTSPRSYDNQAFAQGMSLRAGLVFYNPTHPGIPWEADKTVRVRADVTLPLPDWLSAGKPSINRIGRPDLARVTGCTPYFASLILEERKKGDFTTVKRFIARMTTAYGTISIFNREMPKVKSVLSENGNGPGKKLSIKLPS